MAPFTLAPIVEGHGEHAAVPILLRRIFAEILGQPYVNVLRPIRIPKSKLVKTPELVRAVSLADLKLRDAASERRTVVIIFDADQDAACEMAPRLLGSIRERRPDIDVVLVMAVPEYETWFVGAAESLNDYLDSSHSPIPTNVDTAGVKKAWLQQHFRGRYTETIEQPALTAMMDLSRCRMRSPSFDKLCRDLEKRTEAIPTS